MTARQLLVPATSPMMKTPPNESAPDVDGASDVKKIWEGYGWQVEEIADGNSMSQVLDALGKPRPLGRPTIYIAHTVKGKGVPFIQQNPSWHHKHAITDEEMERLYGELQDY